MLRTLPLSAALLTGASATASAACALQNETQISVMFAAFPAWKAIGAAMEECGSVQIEFDQEIRTKLPPALAASPALYDIGGISNSSIVPLMNDRSIRPQGYLVAKYGAALNPNQLIKIDGKIMAIALMVNVEQLYYRKDIFDKLGIAVPKTYDEVLAAAETIRKAGVIDYPLGAIMKADWDIGIKFTSIFNGFRGAFVNKDNAPAVNSEAGPKTLVLMKRISGYLDPGYMVSDATFAQQQMQQGKIAMTNLWVSRAGTMEDPTESAVIGKIATAPAPLAEAGGVPETILYWDGFGIAANISDEKAEAAFRFALEGADEETILTNNDATLWLGTGFESGPLVAGALASVQNGARAGASTSWNGLMMSAVEKNAVAFMTGRKSAEEALKAMEVDYTVAAKKAGLL